jgi:methylated-DNA-[protein]-cysteine S-methyltransferase
MVQFCESRRIAMNEYRFFIEHVPAPTGTMLLVTDEQDALRALDWEDYEPRLHRLLRLHYGEGRTRLAANPRISTARRALEAYHAGTLSALDTVRVQTGGTAFQREVWAALRTIQVGTTTTYGRLAAQLGRPKAMRAVGMANGANPIGIVVPCHRVIGADASLTGYGGGIERKRWLLAHERVRIARIDPAADDPHLPGLFPPPHGSAPKLAPRVPAQSGPPASMPANVPAGPPDRS